MDLSHMTIFHLYIGENFEIYCGSIVAKYQSPHYCGNILHTVIGFEQHQKLYISHFLLNEEVFL